MTVAASSSLIIAHHDRAHAGFAPQPPAPAHLRSGSRPAEQPTCVTPAMISHAEDSDPPDASLAAVGADDRTLAVAHDSHATVRPPVQVPLASIVSSTPLLPSGSGWGGSRRTLTRWAWIIAILAIVGRVTAHVGGDSRPISYPWLTKDGAHYEAFDLSFDDESAQGGKPRQGRQASADPIVEAKIYTIRLNQVSKDVSYADDGLIRSLRGKNVDLIIYGFGLTNETLVKLSTAKADYGQPCKSDSYHVQTRAFDIEVNEDGTSGRLELPGDRIDQSNGVFYFCLRSGDGAEYIHQGTSSFTSIDFYEMILPIWIMVIIIVILLSLSGLFSGLNLGLMALDQTELKIVQNTGSPREKGYANKIAPIRSHGNFLLCSLLLGNVLVNNTLTILLDTLTSGLVAVIGATMGIVIFGEIIPQAICSRHGLAVGAYTILLTKFFMVVTFPLSYPISRLLDVILGAEIGVVYNKIKLIELLRVTNESNDLEKEEVDIVTGALVYKDKTVRDVMTKLDDVYMLPTSAVLDFDTVSGIRTHGYSRIPIFDSDRRNIMYILFAKDLMFVDPDDKMPVTMLCEFYNNDVNFVFHDTPLNVMFNDFKSGDKGHMAFVKEINNEGDGDPFYETIGLVTLEDIIEEIIQTEIVDETDVILDNRTKKRRNKEWRAMDSGFPLSTEEQKRRVNVSNQLTLAVFQYLATSIEPFRSINMLDSVLKKLLSLDIFGEVKIKKDKSQQNDDDLIIIKKGQPIDFFILIVEGRVEVSIGQEDLVFESGPFSYYGIQVLNQALQGPPPSPCLTRAGPLQSSMSHSDNVASTIRASLRKASTSAASVIDMATSKTDLARRNTMANVVASTGTIPEATQLSTSRPGSALLASNNNHLLNAFVPDYTVKAATDLLYLRVKKSLYSAAAKASAASRKLGSANMEVNVTALDHYLEQVHEDDGAVDHDMMMMIRSPSGPSPDEVNVTNTGLSKLSPLSDRREEEEDSPTKSSDTPTSIGNHVQALASVDGAQAPKAPKEFWGDESTLADPKDDDEPEVFEDSDSLPFIDKTLLSDVSVGGNNGPASLPSGGEVADNSKDKTETIC